MLNYTAGAVKAINHKVNELLSLYEDPAKDLTVEPSVNIMKIAKACNIKKVVFVPSDQLNGKHAIIKNGVVKIDENDREGQRLFDLAHEVGHIVFNQITMSIEFNITQSANGDKVYLPLVATTMEYKAARHGTRRKSELSPGEREIEDFFDHFAANLLVPISRFQLWEHKSDREIAEAFKVEEKCIKKRRQEIVYETGILTADMKPCSIEAITDPDVNLDIEGMLKEIDS